MQDSATIRLRFQTPTPLPLEAAFDGGRITSDRDLGLCEAVAEHVPEWRGRSVNHSLLALVRQRVYQIASGYEDQNDANTLRSDPLLKLVLGRLPESDADLASQPTLSRLENAPGTKDCLRIARSLGDLYVGECGKDGAPERVLLDFDATADPAHGEQEGTYYHGYYGPPAEGCLQGGDAGERREHPLRRDQPPRGAKEALRLVREARGERGWIKEFKRALKADRLSCRRFFANQFRLLLHAAAYWLLDDIRRRLVGAGVPRMQLDTVRLLLVKIGGRVRQLLTKIRLHLASGHPGQHLWHTLSSAEPGHARE